MHGWIIQGGLKEGNCGRHTNTRRTGACTDLLWRPRIPPTLIILTQAAVALEQVAKLNGPPHQHGHPVVGPRDSAAQRHHTRHATVHERDDQGSMLLAVGDELPDAPAERADAAVSDAATFGEHVEPVALLEEGRGVSHGKLIDSVPSRDGHDLR